MSASASRRDNTDRSLARSAWEKRPSKEPSRRVRYDREQLDPEVCLVEMCGVFVQKGKRQSVRTPARITPYPTGRLFWGGAFPRHFVPGYDRTVPPGHFATDFVKSVRAKQEEDVCAPRDVKVYLKAVTKCRPARQLV